MDRPNNLFDKIDELTEKVEKLDSILTGNQASKDAANQEKNRQRNLKDFISKSKKEYIWFGPEKEFKESKKETLILIAILCGTILFATIFSGIACNLYTTFSFFENIWLIMMCYVAYYVYKSKHFYECYEFSKKSFFKFFFDVDGVLRKGPPKRRYKTFLIINCICAGANIIAAWTDNFYGMAIMATIFELGVIVLSIYIYNFRILGFFDMYMDLRFSVKSEILKQEEAIVFSFFENALYTEEEYFKKFPFYK